MNIVERARTDISSLEDLKKLLGEAGPCVSIYMPLSKDSTAGLNPNAKQNALHWRENLRQLEQAGNAFGAEGRQLLGLLQNWETIVPDSPEGETSGGCIAVFRSPHMFQVVLLDGDVPTHTSLGPTFYIRPLLAELGREQRFYILALSQKDTRLIRCTRRSSEEVRFTRDIQTSFDTWMNQAQPDHRAVNNGMSTGHQGTTQPNALAPKGSDQDKKDQYLSHYFKQIDRGVHALLKDTGDTLILCAVEYETALYRTVNSYPQLACEDVKGAANGLKSGEMHARALEVIANCYAKKIDDVLTEWNHRAGGGASSRLKEVLTAAHEGRVLTLLISESLEQPGVFDETSFQAKGGATGGPEDQDLVNDAAVQTILHAGRVLVAPRNKMPHGSPVAAIYRY